MGQMTVQFVRPDRLLYEGPVDHLVLASYTGELGVWPGHEPEICALGDGVVRLSVPESSGGGVHNVIISGGYAEITPNQVIILADHARAANDIEPDIVRETRAKAQSARDALPAEDHRRAYYDNKIAWCDLLLRYANEE